MLCAASLSVFLSQRIVSISYIACAVKSQIYIQRVTGTTAIICHPTTYIWNRFTSLWFCPPLTSPQLTLHDITKSNVCQGDAETGNMYVGAGTCGGA